MSFTPQQPRIDDASAFFKASVDVLRLDILHPVVSGNKWFKLTGYLAEAAATGKETLVTFGGAYSNHIIATAAAAQMHGLKSIGIIRGEEPIHFSHTLRTALQYGMTLHYVSRESYRKKELPPELSNQHSLSSILIIPGGGYGRSGAEGAKEILLTSVNTSSYTHIVSAVGTGTTLAGLIEAASPSQKVVGISAMKNAFSLHAEIKALLANDVSFQLLHDYHFGGYAKHKPELLAFMNTFHSATGIPIDFVYTAKAFYAVMDLLQKNFFESPARILLIHTGGLQGNRSLPAGTLIFPS